MIKELRIRFHTNKNKAFIIKEMETSHQMNDAKLKAAVRKAIERAENMTKAEIKEFEEWMEYCDDCIENNIPITVNKNHSNK